MALVPAEFGAQAAAPPPAAVQPRVPREALLHDANALSHLEWSGWIEVMRYRYDIGTATGWRRSSAACYRIREEQCPRGKKPSVLSRTLAGLPELNVRGIYEWKCTVTTAEGERSCVFYVGRDKSCVRDRIAGERSLNPKILGKGFKRFAIEMFNWCLSDDRVQTSFSVRVAAAADEASAIQMERAALGQFDYFCNKANNNVPRVDEALRLLHAAAARPLVVERPIAWADLIAALRHLGIADRQDELAMLLNAAAAAAPLAI